MRTLDCIAACSILLASAAASATPPSADAAVLTAVERDLLAPLVKRDAEKSRFSRAGPSPKERRVRVLDAAAVQDASGRAFRSFAVDARRLRGEDAPWQQDEIVGCIYGDDDKIYVKIGDEYRVASFLLGKKVAKAPATVCRAQTAGQVATNARGG